MSSVMSLTESLIAYVKKYPQLYDPSHEGYKDTREKDCIWNIIGSDLDEDGEVLKRKWKNIRDSYAKHLRSALPAAKASLRKSYSNWPWSQQMEVFRQFMRNPSLKLRKRNKFNNMVQTDQVQSVETLVDPDIIEICEENSDSMTDDYKPDIGDSFTTSLTVGTRKRETQADDEEEDDGEKGVKEHKGKRRKLDAVDLIFQGYAQIVKTFSFKRQAQVKLKIAELMANHEIEHHDEKLT